MTPSVLPFAPVERSSDSRATRGAGGAREATRDDRPDRSDAAERGDFAGELAAAREAAAAVRDREAAAEREVGHEAENASEATGAREASRPGTSATDVSRNMEDLNPELRDAVERVIARMRSEYGHQVTVVEGVRSQERQAQLFAQGRTAPGSVVTWTMNSKHLTGHAADLMVDGGWTNREGYAQLQKVASEEGLKVLGMKDPGHVELRSESSVRFAHSGASGTQENTPGASARVAASDALRQLHGSADNRLPSQAGIATQAAVAEVARVAEPAAVARTASVAQVAWVASPGSAASSSSRGGAGNEQGSSARQDGSRQQASSHSAPLVNVDGGAALPQAQEMRLSSQMPEMRGSETMSGADPLSRIAQVDQVREAVGSRQPSALTLRLDNGMGGEDRIRLDMRGNTVGATMDVGDVRLAERIGSTMHELRQALERRGLAAERLQVRVPGADALDAARVNGVQLEREAGRFSSAQHTPQRQSEEHASWQQRDSHSQREPNDSGHQRQRQDRGRNVPVFSTEER